MIHRLDPISEAALAGPAEKQPSSVEDLTISTPIVRSERALASLAIAVGAKDVGRLSAQERNLTRRLEKVPQRVLRACRDLIAEGADPLGQAFCQLRSPEARRIDGAVYTPAPIVEAMLAWAESAASPTRIVDPGTGSARFLLAGGRTFPEAELIGVETDPLAALIARANLAVAGMAKRADVLVQDFRSAKFAEIEGATLYIGNPPYVRHHQIAPEWKDWLAQESSRLGLKASKLAGLHVYFFLAVAQKAKPGDFGAFITAAEWLDVNYGKLVRELFLQRLGGQAVFLIEPKAEPFPGTQTTGAVTTFKVDDAPKSARFARINKLEHLDHLSGGRRVRRERLIAEPRWSHFTRKARVIPEGFIELGELCRVHRGQVTGANHIWIDGDHSEELPESVKLPTVTKALELFRAGRVLQNPAGLRRVIDLPTDLSLYEGQERRAIYRFLKTAEGMGARKSYTASHRAAWWSVGLRDPAPILATYMARRPPAFVLNRAEARHLNIAHGIYPRTKLAKRTIDQLVRYLRGSSSLSGGRVYSGGLTKFEPREMERIPIPSPELLAEMIP